MNILDENIPAPEPEKLRRYKIPFKQIGIDLAEKGVKDYNDILPLLHSLKEPTFFTRDSDFFQEKWTHDGYCLVILTVEANETGETIRRFLKHSEFDTVAKRMGKVVRLGTDAITVFEKGKKNRLTLKWE